MPQADVLHGDSREVLAMFPDDYFDSVVTDPPYALVSIGKRFGAPDAAACKAGVYRRASAGFMGKTWDTGETAFDPMFWFEVLRVLKPGGHLVAFGGTRSYHRLACAVEDAGFEIRDQIAWVYGSGFPKSHDVSKGIDKAAGAEREVLGARVKTQSYGANEVFGDRPEKHGVQPLTAPATPEAAAWTGWGTALKPAIEPIVLARKPLARGMTVAANVLAHGTGALNIDGCRVEHAGTDGSWGGGTRPGGFVDTGAAGGSSAPNGQRHDLGRWPANVIHDGSDEVLAAFPQAKGQIATASTSDTQRGGQNVYGDMTRGSNGSEPRADTGSAARFFYCAKASRADRNSGGLTSHHPTVKPTDLMRYLCRLVTPPGGVVLDPFCGSGSTGKAAGREGFGFIGIEREAEYVAIARARVEAARVAAAGAA